MTAKPLQIQPVDEFVEIEFSSHRPDSCREDFSGPENRLSKFCRYLESQGEEAALSFLDSFLDSFDEYTGISELSETAGVRSDAAASAGVEVLVLLRGLFLALGFAILEFLEEPVFLALEEEKMGK